MTTWTTPKTWQTGDLVTAAELNAQIRDNMLYLKQGVTLDYVERDATYTTTTHNIWTDIDPNYLSLTVVTKGGPVLVGFSAVGDDAGDPHRTPAVDYTLDGTRQGTSKYGLAYRPVPDVRSNLRLPMAFAHLQPNLPAGSHTVTLQWAAVHSLGHSGQPVKLLSSSSGGFPIRFWVMEFSA